MPNDDILSPEETINSDKQLTESLEVEAIAKRVVEKHKMKFGPAEIGYFLVYPNISRQKAAKCIKASHQVKYYSGYNYLIEISGELWDMLDNQTKEMLLYHELLHVDPNFKSKTQEWKMNIRKPDFSDFYAINDKYGNELYKTIQATISPLYDLDSK